MLAITQVKGRGRGKGSVINPRDLEEISNSPIHMDPTEPETLHSIRVLKIYQPISLHVSRWALATNWGRAVKRLPA